jgi:hypothetical protein
MYKSKGPALSHSDGQAIHVFPFWPNFRRDFIERWEWKTNVIRSFNGTEQRIRLRRHPRRYFEFEVFAKSTDRAAFENFLWNSQTKLFAVPVWPAAAKLAAAPSNGFLSIYSANYVGGGYAVGFGSPTDTDLRTVASVSGSGVQLNDAVTWVRGTTVCPAILGYMDPQQTITRVTGDFAYALVTFSFLPALSPYDGAVTAYPSYKGFKVLEDILDWSQGVETEFSYKTQTYDIQTNAPMIDIESNTPSITQQAHWFLNGNAKVSAFLKVIHYAKGRCIPFWMPSGSVDLIPTNVTGNQLVTYDSGYTRFIAADDTSRKHIRVQKTNGQVLYRKITAATASAGNTETFTLDTALGIPVSQIKMISFMSLARFDNDRVELAYKGPTFGTSTNLIRTLKHDL